MRLFAALLPPERVRLELAATVRRLRGLPGADGLRWVQPANWHCTLAFFGEVEEARYEELARQLGWVSAHSTPQRLRVAAGGRFGDRVLWAGLADAFDHPRAGTTGQAETEDDRGRSFPPRPEPHGVRRLAEAATAAGGRVGVPVVESRPFLAHLTLARGRGESALATFADALAGTVGSPWTANELVLLRSTLPASGNEEEQPRYETVEAWPLGRHRRSPVYPSDLGNRRAAATVTVEW